MSLFGPALLPPLGVELELVMRFSPGKVGSKIELGRFEVFIVKVFGPAADDPDSILPGDKDLRFDDEDGVPCLSNEAALTEN